MIEQENRRPMTFGAAAYADITGELNDTFRERGVLIAAHRGTPRGDILENTLDGVRATKAVGADIAEMDVIRSTDGEYFAFHDGFEFTRLRQDISVLGMTAAQLDATRYSDYPDTYYGPIERIAHILEGAPDILINVDRSWRYWDSGLLDWLDRFGMERRLILKSPVDERYLDALRGHDVKYMYMAMVHDMEELELLDRLDGVNLVGVEIISSDPDRRRLGAEIFDAVHRRGLYTFVNALGLGNNKRGFQGLDDATSILNGADSGWGLLIDLGADVIQTDWPEMLRAYRRTR